MNGTKTNGQRAATSAEALIAAARWKAAAAEAEIYHGKGTAYLHTDNPLTQSNHADGSVDSANPTGAVVPAISLATTFRQSTPGEPTARNDPNSFGMGYEYSRTGTRAFAIVLIRYEDHLIPSLFHYRKPNAWCVRTRR